MHKISLKLETDMKKLFIYRIVAQFWALILMLTMGFMPIAEADDPFIYVGPIFFPSFTPSYFNCGPHVYTYVVSNPNGTPEGIRCVKFESTGADYSFYWYGEGKKGNDAYRHVGYTYKHGSIYASIEDISGNGEVFQSVRNFRMSAVSYPSAPAEILMPGITGGTEVWKLVTTNGTKNVLYSPLTPVKVCGPNFNTYNARASGGVGPVMGVRCVSKNTGIWFGTGNWDTNYLWGGEQYMHLGKASTLISGSASFNAVSADLCNLALGKDCKSFSGIWFTPVANRRDFNISGIWNEYWSYPLRQEVHVPDESCVDELNADPQFFVHHSVPPFGNSTSVDMKGISWLTGCQSYTWAQVDGVQKLLVEPLSMRRVVTSTARNQASWDCANSSISYAVYTKSRRGLGSQWLFRGKGILMGSAPINGSCQYNVQNFGSSGLNQVQIPVDNYTQDVRIAAKAWSHDDKNHGNLDYCKHPTDCYWQSNFRVTK